MRERERERRRRERRVVEGNEIGDWAMPIFSLHNNGVFFPTIVYDSATETDSSFFPFVPRCGTLIICGQTTSGDAIVVTIPLDLPVAEKTALYQSYFGTLAEMRQDVRIVRRGVLRRPRIVVYGTGKNRTIPIPCGTRSSEFVSTVHGLVKFIKYKSGSLCVSITALCPNRVHPLFPRRLCLSKLDHAYDAYLAPDTGDFWIGPNNESRIMFNIPHKRQDGIATVNLQDLLSVFPDLFSPFDTTVPTVVRQEINRCVARRELDLERIIISFMYPNPIGL